MTVDRRRFLQTTLAGGACAAAGLAASTSRGAAKETLYKISLAEYSLHRMIAKKALDPLDFAPFTKKEFGIDAVEHWNRPFFTKAEDKKYLADMKQRADDAGVKSLLIMIDGEGNLGDPDEQRRSEAVNKHHKWVLAARQLGCHSIRVNARSDGKKTYDEQMKLAAAGLRSLSEFGAEHECNVIVENHGGLSSNGRWLAGVMELVDLPNCGTLPDFGNFRVSGNQWYDRYQGIKELMPFAKAVSAKSHHFDEEGNETSTDYFKMMKIVLDAGYHGYVGIEFEGGKISEVEGVRATQKLLERVRQSLS